MIGLRRGDCVLVHSSYRSLGIDHPETLIHALLLHRMISSASSSAMIVSLYYWMITSLCLAVLARHRRA
jgi:hypothetical protein